MKSIVFLLVTAMIIFGCARNSGGSVNRIDVAGQKAYQLDIENVKDSIVLNFSDIADNLHFIRLETNPNCMLNHPKFYIGKKYILSFEINQPIYQFDIDGNYLRTITTPGEGPQEVTRFLWAVDEFSNILYVRDDAKDHYISFDLITGKFLQEIPAAFTGSINQFVVTEPGVFAVAPYLDKSVLTNRYSMYWQNTKGIFLGGIQAPSDSNLHISAKVLFQYPGYLGYYFEKLDTLYKIEGQERSVKWILKPVERNQNVTQSVGDKRINIISLQENFILCTYFITGRVIVQGRSTYATGQLFHLFVNKKKQEVHYISKFTVDDLGQPVRLVLLNSQPDGTLFLSFNAIEIKEMISKSLVDSEIDSEQRSKLKELSSLITENDNPVLLVGKARNP